MIYARSKNLKKTAHNDKKFKYEVKDLMPFADPEKAKRLVGCAAHRETAARLAENSVSLLKNTDLPVKPSKKIFVYSSFL